MGQKDLAIYLSKLAVFDRPKMLLEQHPTDSDVAAEMLWFAYMNDDLEDKTIADFGAGTGILGIGSILLGAKKVFFVEKDAEAIKTLKKNIKPLEVNDFEIIHMDVRDFKKKVDTIIQNPPFGTKNAHADFDFLKRAMKLGNVVYSFHKVETKPFIQKTISSLGGKMTHYFEFDFPLKNTMEHHKKKLEYIKVGCWRITTK